jgi:5'-3' exonuclease
MNKFSYSDIDRLAMTCIPPYPAPDLLQNMVAFHRNLSKHITPLYVFDGIAPSLKDVTRDKRDMTREAAGKDWEKMVNKVIQRDDAQLSEEEMQKATASRMGMKKTNPVDRAAILKWMKEENIRCCGSLLEADQQMVKLKQDGIVEGITTEEGILLCWVRGECCANTHARRMENINSNITTGIFLCNQTTHTTQR